MRKAIVIVNPKAGRGRASAVAFAVVARLRESSVAAEIVPTDYPRHATELARARRPETDLVVVVGGDGTLRETAVGLDGHAARVAVGFIPMGHGNVVARELEIPLEPDAALELVLRGRPRLMDVGRVNGEVFLAMVGFGFDALVTRWVARWRAGRVGGRLYRWLGDAMYGLAGSAALFRLVPTRCSLTVDGRPLARRPATVIVSNTRTWSKGWSMTPDADPFDGLLDYQACWRAAPPPVVWTLIQAKRRRPVPPFISEFGRGRSFAIEADAPFAWQADGDPMEPVARLDIEIVPGFLNLIAP